MAKKRINPSDKEQELGSKTNSLVFIDFETGGFEPQECAVTEVAALAIRGDTLEVIDMYNTYIQPYGEYKYNDDALKATGITFKDIDSGVPVEEAMDRLIALLKKADLYNSKGFKPIIVAHNGDFDRDFLVQLFNYTKKLKELPKLLYGKENFYGHFMPHILDSVVMGKLAFGHIPDFGNMKLASFIAACKAELGDGHKAINDTIGLKEAMVNLIRGLRIGLGQDEQEVLKSTKFREHFQF